LLSSVVDPIECKAAELSLPAESLGVQLVIITTRTAHSKSQSEKLFMAGR
jgi:hypothetical protein